MKTKRSHSKLILAQTAYNNQKYKSTKDNSKHCRRDRIWFQELPYYLIQTSGFWYKNHKAYKQTVKYEPSKGKKSTETVLKNDKADLQLKDLNNHPKDAEELKEDVKKVKKQSMKKMEILIKR